PTTKDVVLEERKDMLIEFQRLEEAIVEDMPRDLEGPTDDLVEVGLLETNRRVVRGVPGIEQPVFDEEWAAAAAASRKRRAVRQPSGSDGEDSESEEKKRAAAKARFGSLRTATDEELRRALDGSLAVKDITRPPAAAEAAAGGGAGANTPARRRTNRQTPSRRKVRNETAEERAVERDAMLSNGEIVAEPEEVHVEDVTMASGDQEPRPA
ncbi:hypothetical protein CYMTET_32500, partial [Cymbomonas tetramitiformis]